jgi:oxygen-independent coproporphyrinogen-3 oxidase
VLNARAALAVPADLLARYDVAIPRYTSYPALPDWTGGVDEAGWLAHVARTTGAAAPLALYVHLPFCASQCLYCGCNATVTRRQDVVDRYLDRLEREVARVSRAIGAGAVVAEMHWGGGTPNFLDAAQLDRLVRLLRGAFTFDARTESSIEADPRLVTGAQLAQLRALGFTRISFGVQDLDPEVQEAIGRVQPGALVRAVVDEARAAGFQGINVDLIYGLPRQTEATFHRTLEETIAFGPDRVACFGYAHVPWMRAHQRRIDETTLPVGAQRFALFRHAVERFLDAGYTWIGLDHFALPGDPMARAARAGELHRNFMGYTTRVGEQLLGLGVSAISDVDGWYAQQAPGLGEWQRANDAGNMAIVRGHILSQDDRTRGAAITRLMCNAELPYHAWPLGAEDLRERLADLATDGLVTFGADRVGVAPVGRFFLRNICAALDAYREVPGTAQRFSRAV